MKNIIKYIPLLLLTLLASCGKDNYDAPESTLTGRIVYNGNPVQVRGTGEAVRIYLYQDGWQLHNQIEVFVTQDGSFSAKLFNGEYKLVTRDNNGPWVNVRDTTTFTVKGSHSLDLNVTPYFTISDENVSLSGTNLSVSFNINQIVSTAQIEKVYLILSKTQFADEVNNIVRQDVTNIKVGSNTLSVDLSGNAQVAAAQFLYGRIGVKTQGVGEAIWTPVKKLR
ncbi:MAG: DUF3823 domain-containing protein [Tannerella sp.]|jgi:hypothetical protein|nr:DUF3823 domain-containing protein [Tannerella sp.]